MSAWVKVELQVPPEEMTDEDLICFSRLLLDLFGKLYGELLRRMKKLLRRELEP